MVFNSKNIFDKLKKKLIFWKFVLNIYIFFKTNLRLLGVIRISKPLNFVWCYTIGCSKNNSFEYWFLQFWVGLMKPILFSSLTKVSTVLLGPERRFWITKAWPRYKWVWQNWWVESPKVSSILNKLWIFFFYFFYGNYCTWVFSIIIWKYPPNISKQKNKNKNKNLFLKIKNYFSFYDYLIYVHNRLYFYILYDLIYS